MNWFDILKTQGLVNLPKFKVKPFNTAKPNEEDTRCKDKIIEIANFTKNFDFPDKIAQEFVRVKRENSLNSARMHYYGEETETKMSIGWLVSTENHDEIPEEVYCKALDMVNTGGIQNTNVMDYGIGVQINRQDEYFTQQVIISHSTRLKKGYVYLFLNITWGEWFNSIKQTDMDDWQSTFIDEELIELADKMEWPK